MAGFQSLDNEANLNARHDSSESRHDIPNRLGSTNTDGQSIFTELQSTASVERRTSSLSLPERWEMNYHEAAIFLEEGINNEKFKYHPKSKNDLPLYIIVHTHIFYCVDLFSCLLLISLVLVETPAVPLFKLSAGVHASLELLALFVICIQLVVKIRWIGLQEIFQHKRTLLKVFCLFIMLVEAVVVIIRQKSHFRVTRALRPMFLVDNHYMGGVRRFVRQILQSLPPIMDMLFLILFFMLIFATLGFYLFSSNASDPYFQTLKDSFVSLFILLTTANYPDVMMPAYNTSRWSVIFFVVYLVINLYFLMNLMLAVVYEKFTNIEKEKFRKLLLHSRRACQHAFHLLVPKRNPDHITFRHFEGLMRYHKPKTSKRDVYLTFKTLDTHNSGYITLEEFYQVYEVCSLKWKPKKSHEIPWYEGLWKPIRVFCSAFRTVVTWKYFDVIINIVVLCQGVWQVLDAALFGQDTKIKHDIATDISYVFVSIYTVEAIMKLLGLGISAYLANGWNLYDFLITIISIAGIIAENFNAPFYFIVVLRPLRLLRLFKIKKRYRDVFGTVFILLSRLASVAVVFLIVFYFFAVIGMELFSHYDMTNCCQNSSVAAQYKFTKNYQGYYYLNNFDDIFHACVTLFELTVVNNWFIIMDGYASVASEWSRIYFMTFYIVTMVVLQIIVAFILEAFLFRIQYKRKMGDMDKDTLVKVDIGLTREEIDFCYSMSSSVAELTSYSRALDASMENNRLMYRGVRTRTKNSFYMKMYEEEVKEWLLKEEELESQRRAALCRMLNDDLNVSALAVDDVLDLSRRAQSI